MKILRFLVFLTYSRNKIRSKLEQQKSWMEMQMRLILLDKNEGVQAKACLRCQRIIKVERVKTIIQDFISNCAFWVISKVSYFVIIDYSISIAKKCKILSHSRYLIFLCEMRFENIFFMFRLYPKPNFYQTKFKRFSHSSQVKNVLGSETFLCT